MSNLIFRTLLSGINWASIVHMLGLSERTNGIGDGSIDGHKFIVIQRGDEILIVLPEYQTREKCHEVANKIFSKLDPKSKIQIVTMGHASSHCNYCLKPIPLPYRCYRCDGWYCASHRLPEQHNCPGGKAEKAVQWVRSKKKEEKREIVLVEAPCG